MNRLRNTVAALCVVLLPMSGMAQEHMSKAIDEFGADVSRNGIKMSKLEKDTTKAYAKTYTFLLPKKNEDRLNSLKKAFYQDAPDAYEVLTKTEDERSKKNLRIAYGDNLEKYINFGWPYNKTGQNYMFMFVEDKDDANFRYALGLEWKKNGKNIEGTVVKIYSLDPKKVKTKKKSSLAKSYSIVGDSLKLLGLDGMDISNANGDMVLKSGKSTVVIKKDGVYLDDGKGSTTIIGSKGMAAYSKDMAAAKELNADPITKFNNLRATYMNNIREGNIDNTTLLTGLANYILNFCKTNGKLMSTDERRLCMEGLQEMQERTPDKYIKGIFGLAIKAME